MDARAIGSATKRVARAVKRRIVPSSNNSPEWRGYGPDGFPCDAWADPRYQAWFEDHVTPATEIERQRKAWTAFSIQPLFSIIVPLYKTPIDYLMDMVESVMSQSYAKFELILVNASPEMDDLSSAVNIYCETDSRIKTVVLEDNYGITENTNFGIEVAQGDFCCFCDHDDWLEPDLLFDYVQAINDNPQIDLLYCDEDLVDSDHRHLHPLFKPDYAPELLLSKNYIVHLMTVRRSIIDKMPTPGKEFDGAQDYNMVLFAAENARAVHHTPKVHYHWRVSETSTAAKPEAKPYSRRAYRKSIFNHMQRMGIDAYVNYCGIVNIYNPRFREDKGVPTTLIVRQAASLEELCDFLYAYRQMASDQHELIVVTDEESALAEEFPGMDFACVKPESGMFQSLNKAAAQATRDYLVFMDDSTIPLSGGFLDQLTTACTMRGVGVVGPKLLYTDYSVCSYGVAVTPERIMPLYRGYPEAHPGYQCNTRASQNASAVSLAGLTVSRSLFEHVGGFGEDYSSELGAVDFCQKVLQEGQRVAVFNHVLLMSRVQKPERAYDNSQNAPDYPLDQVALFDKAWPGLRQKPDPYFSPNLDQASCYCQVQGENYPPQ